MYRNHPSKALCLLIALAFVACEGAAVPQALISFNDLSPEKERSAAVSDNLPITCSQFISPDGKVNIAALAALDTAEPSTTLGLAQDPYLQAYTSLKFLVDIVEACAPPPNASLSQSKGSVWSQMDVLLVGLISIVLTAVTLAIIWISVCIVEDYLWPKIGVLVYDVERDGFYVVDGYKVAHDRAVRQRLADYNNCQHGVAEADCEKAHHFAVSRQC